MSWSISKKLVWGSAILFLFIIITLGWVSKNDSVALDSASKEIVEKIDNSDDTFLNKILPQESPVVSALVFAGNLGNSLNVVFHGTKDNQTVPISGGPDEYNDLYNLETANGNSLVAQEPVLAIIPADSSRTFEDGNILTYEIEQGDSLQSIADDFGVSISTLLSANNIPAGTKLKLGDKLAILPVDGVKHIVKVGDTIESIAQKYKADPDRIIAFNGLSDDGDIKTSDTLVIPGGEYHEPISAKYAPAQSLRVQDLPNLIGYYGLPSGGRITQGLHRFNGVDIGGRDWCNTPLYAAAAGTIITADSQGWNGGYGKYIKIAHDNGTITLYAHSSQLLVNVGQYVGKGQTIALMGSTGRATGCHVHFEVRGARNPLANY